MHNDRKRIFLVATLAFGMAASAGAQGSGIPVAKDVDRSAIDAANANRMGGREGGRMNMMAGDIELARRFSDANITDHLIGGDSLEIAIAQLAQARAQDQRVRDYAAMLVRDHTTDMQQSRSLAGRSDIGRGMHPADSSGAHLLHVYQRLQGLSGADFDRAFLMSQAQHHAMELAMGSAMRQAARDDALQRHLDDIRPILQGHRDTAMQVARAMGFSRMNGGMRGMMRDSSMAHDMKGMQHDSTPGTRPPR